MFEDTMKMNRNIKITESQYRMLQEADEEMFPYVTDNDAKPFNGYGEISADGKESGEENAHEKTTADKVQQMRTMDGWNRYRTYGNVYPTTVREGVDITNKEDNTADDIGETDAIDSQELENNTLVQIPQPVKEKVNILLNTIQKEHLSAKQQAVVLNDLIKALSSNSTTYSTQKKFDKMIQGNKNISNQLRKNISNND